MSLSHHVERYVTFKQQLGYKYGTEARLLRAWADYAQACGDVFLHNERSIDRACKAPSPGSVRRRLLTVRGLAVWLHAEDPRHEIPSRAAVGPAKKPRPAPIPAYQKPDWADYGRGADLATDRFNYTSYLPLSDWADCSDQAALF